jgi:hypothetical protein
MFPWSIELMSLLTVFVVVAIASAGWVFGGWLMSRILSLFKRGD